MTLSLIILLNDGIKYLQRKKIEITCPKVVIKTYNEKMVVVDVYDQMLECLGIFFKIIKWQFKSVLHLFNLVGCNTDMTAR